MGLLGRRNDLASHAAEFGHFTILGMNRTVSPSTVWASLHFALPPISDTLEPDQLSPAGLQVER